MTSIQMPQLGETIVEGTILKWLKHEGDAVARDEPLFEEAGGTLDEIELMSWPPLLPVADQRTRDS